MLPATCTSSLPAPASTTIFLVGEKVPWLTPLTMASTPPAVPVGRIRMLSAAAVPWIVAVATWPLPPSMPPSNSMEAFGNVPSTSSVPAYTCKTPL